MKQRMVEHDGVKRGYQTTEPTLTLRAHYTGVPLGQDRETRIRKGKKKSKEASRQANERTNERTKEWKGREGKGREGG